MRRPPEEGEGIVVGRQDLGDHDRILRLLTPDRGRRSVVARGGRAAKSRLGAPDLAQRIRYAAHEGELGALASAEVLDGRLHLRASLARLATAAYTCELCAALAREHHAEPRLYGLLETALLLLDASQADPADAFLAGIEAKALTFAGVAPHLDRCGTCGGAAEDDMRFGPGGLIHRRCVETEDRTLSMTPEYAGALEAARRAPLRELLDVRLPEGPRDALYEAIRAHVGRALPSRGVLDALMG